MENKEIPKTERDLNTFFAKERKKTVAFLCGRYHLSYESAEDVFQDSCIALFQNVKNGKLVSLTASLSSYFTKICIFQTLKKIRDTKSFDTLDNGQYDASKVDELLGADGGFTVKQQQAMEDIINHLPPPCDMILWSYYYENMNMSEIANAIDYKNSDSVKAKKAQCMKKLKDRFSNQIKDILYGEDE
ncbi:MAG: sigma-70 family RNA polymerase sigma factor [Bacteroidaceae bacterium]|nr:sigma-70 family RNA polymerase sigma factor [Bacteroidaceae bacterium]